MHVLNKCRNKLLSGNSKGEQQCGLQTESARDGARWSCCRGAGFSPASSVAPPAYQGSQHISRYCIRNSESHREHSGKGEVFLQI